MVSKTFGDKGGPLATGDLDVDFVEVEEQIALGPTSATVTALQQQIVSGDASVLQATQGKIASDGSVAMTANLPLPPQPVTASGSVAANLDTVNAKLALRDLQIAEMMQQIADLQNAAPPPPPAPGAPVNINLPTLTVNASQTLFQFGAGTWSPVEDSNTYRMRRRNRTTSVVTFVVLASLADRARSTSDDDCDIDLEETAIKAGVTPSPIAYSTSTYIVPAIAPPGPAPAPPQTPSIDTLQLVVADGSTFAPPNIPCDNGHGGHQPRVVSLADRTPVLVYHRTISGVVQLRVMKRIAGVWTQQFTVSSGASSGYALVREPATDAVHLFGLNTSLVATVYTSPSYTPVTVPGVYFNDQFVLHYSSAGIGADGTVVFKSYFDVSPGGQYTSVTEVRWTAGKRNGSSWVWGAQQIGNAGWRHTYDYIFPLHGGPTRFSAVNWMSPFGPSIGLPNLQGSPYGYYRDGLRQWTSDLYSLSGYVYSEVVPSQAISASATDAPGTAPTDVFVDSLGRVLSMYFYDDPFNPGDNSWYLLVTNASLQVLSSTAISSIPAGGGCRIWQDAAGAYRIWHTNFSGNPGGVVARVYNLTFSGNTPTLGSSTDVAGPINAAGVEQLYVPRFACPRAGCSIVDRLQFTFTGGSQMSEIWYGELVWGASGAPPPPPPPPSGASFDQANAVSSIGEDTSTSDTVLFTNPAVLCNPGDLIEVEISWDGADTTTAVHTIAETGGATIDAAGGFTAGTKKQASVSGRWVQLHRKTAAVGEAALQGVMTLGAARSNRAVIMRIYPHTGTVGFLSEATATDTPSGLSNTLTYASLTGSTQKLMTMCSISDAGTTAQMDTGDPANWRNYTWSTWAKQSSHDRFITGTATTPTGNVIALDGGGNPISANLASVGNLYEVT